MNNTSKPSSNSLANVSRVNIGELWSTITTTWALETRTWAECASTMDNTSKVSASMTNTSRP